MTTRGKTTLAERRAEELRLTIAHTARDLFIADGDTSATVERICDVVGIAPRTFHRHFPVKEDVIIPLFLEHSTVILDVIEQSAPDSEPVETLVRAFTTEVDARRALELDRKFMTLVANNPEYRLRWLEWCEHLRAPLTSFLSTRVELSDDPFMRELPAKLIMHTSRQIYLRWVTTGDFEELKLLHRQGISMVLAGLSSTMSSPAARSLGNIRPSA